MAESHSFSQADIDQMVREASMAMQRGDFGGASAIAERGIEAGVEHPFLMKVRAFWLHNRGELREALRAFHHARALDPKDPSILNGIAGCLAAMGEYRAAIEMAEASLALAPEAQPTHYLRGWILEMAGELQAARSAYGVALTHGQNDPTVLAALASVSYGLEDYDAARARAHQALAFDPRQITALSALAGSDIAQGKAKEVEPKLRGILQTTMPPRVRAQILSLLGDALDAMNRPADAFATWEQKIVRKDGAKLDPLSPLARMFETIDADAWQGEPANDGKVVPTFVSGTGSELLSQVLAATTSVLRANGSLREQAREYLETPDGLNALSALHGSELDEARAAYWESLGTFGAEAAAIVDQGVRYPLDLPLIAKLFPHAKVLVMVRDPRDAVLEAFRHQMGSDPAGSDTFTLEQCAEAYGFVLTFAETCRQRLPLTFQELRYEDVVADPDAAIKAGMDFLGLELPAEMPRPSRRAKLSAGIWRRYKDEMKPVLPLIEPWAAKLGYPAE